MASLFKFVPWTSSINILRRFSLKIIHSSVSFPIIQDLNFARETQYFNVLIIDWRIINRFRYKKSFQNFVFLVSLFVIIFTSIRIPLNSNLSIAPTYFRCSFVFFPISTMNFLVFYFFCACINATFSLLWINFAPFSISRRIIMKDFDVFPFKRYQQVFGTTRQGQVWFNLQITGCCRLVKNVWDFYSVNDRVWTWSNKVENSFLRFFLLSACDSLSLKFSFSQKYLPSLFKRKKEKRLLHNFVPIKLLLSSSVVSLWRNKSGENLP